MKFTRRIHADYGAIAISRRTTLSALLIVGLATTGCAGIRPYSEVAAVVAVTDAIADALQKLNA